MFLVIYSLATFGKSSTFPWFAKSLTVSAQPIFSRYLMFVSASFEMTCISVLKYDISKSLNSLQNLSEETTFTPPFSYSNLSMPFKAKISLLGLLRYSLKALSSYLMILSNVITSS